MTVAGSSLAGPVIFPQWLSTLALLRGAEVVAGLERPRR